MRLVVFNIEEEIFRVIKYVDIYNNIIMFSFDKCLDFLKIMVGFSPVAIHDMCTEFRSRSMLKNTAGLFDQMVSRFPMKIKQNSFTNWSMIYEIYTLMDRSRTYPSPTIFKYCPISRTISWSVFVRLMGVTLFNVVTPFSVLPFKTWPFDSKLLTASTENKPNK